MSSHPAPIPSRGAHVVSAGTRFVLGGGWLTRLATPRIERMLAAIDAGLVQGALEVTLPNGLRRRLGGRASGPEAAIALHNWRPAIRLAVSGSSGFARAYVDNDWTSPNPVTLFELFMLNRVALGHISRGGRLTRFANRLSHALQANTRIGAKRNIAFHYDLGNDFYASWLDTTMTYSSAVFEGDESLEEAQRRKVRLLLDRLAIRPGDHLLEIGCGWGGLAEIAARDYGACVTGLTLSEAQLAYAHARIASAGLADRVNFELRDYRDIDGTFDHVVSVEMFEAVGRRYWPLFMEGIARVLKPGGRAAIQAITIDEAIFEDYASSVDFIQAYIFPGGMLPSEPRFRAAAEAAGLIWHGSAAYGAHYVRTLQLWRDRFDAARGEGRLPSGFDDRFARIWRLYLMYCEGGFRSGGINVVQTTLVKPVAPT